MYTNFMTYTYYHCLLHIGSYMYKLHSFGLLFYTKNFFQRQKGEVKLEERKLWKSK